ncbi:hypothetical protein [Candidatus Chlorohelix sp.]|uniref:hypothetical protein n=1 Tax=Candidatus Chlorohelix sp. TaxID=3139201 RepID=UPI0030382E83
MTRILDLNSTTHPEALRIKPDCMLGTLSNLREQLAKAEILLASIPFENQNERRSQMEKVKTLWNQIAQLASKVLTTEDFGNAVYLNPDAIDVPPTESFDHICPLCQGTDLVTNYSGITFCKVCDEELLLSPLVNVTEECQDVLAECPFCHKKDLAITYSNLTFCKNCDEDFLLLRQA